MLVLTRCLGEELVIANTIRVKIVALENGRVKLGITAPHSVTVHREEVHRRLHDPQEGVEPKENVVELD